MTAPDLKLKIAGGDPTDRSANHYVEPSQSDSWRAFQMPKTDESKRITSRSRGTTLATALPVTHPHLFEPDVVGKSYVQLKKRSCEFNKKERIFLDALKISRNEEMAVITPEMLEQTYGIKHDYNAHGQPYFSKVDQEGLYELMKMVKTFAVKYGATNIRFARSLHALSFLLCADSTLRFLGGSYLPIGAGLDATSRPEGTYLDLSSANISLNGTRGLKLNLEHLNALSTNSEISTYSSMLSRNSQQSIEVIGDANNAHIAIITPTEMANPESIYRDYLSSNTTPRHLRRLFLCAEKRFDRGAQCLFLGTPKRNTEKFRYYDQLIKERGLDLDQFIDTLRCYLPPEYTTRSLDELKK